MDSKIENKLASHIQADFPIVARPYLAMADLLETTETEVIHRINEWKNEKKLRDISVILEGAFFGYDSALVCVKCPEEKMDQIASIISEHPGVTHNYRRQYEYNLWFTIAVPPDHKLEEHVNIFSEKIGLQSFHILRRTHTFKIGVSFDFESKKNHTDTLSEMSEICRRDFTEYEIRMIRAAQLPLQSVSRPYASNADRYQVTEEDLLSFLNREKGKIVRRMAGIFRHRKMGIAANGMVVWKVHSDDLQLAGSILSACPEVSHCYARNGFEGFPYTLFSMVHASDSGELNHTIAQLSKQCGIQDYLILESTEEFKKVRMKYFTEDLEEWFIKNLKFKTKVNIETI